MRLTLHHQGRHRPMQVDPPPLVETWESCRTWYARPTLWARLTSRMRRA